ncbi:hypothetical protein niasHT_008340 [Heterodera trifolii]|uniref:Uncharacterized protein n=1 Tax=Heterodera trifolii TaxID=157864 RepID=A0ABD2M1G5_9BILA
MCMDTWSLNVPHTVLVATMAPRVWRALPVKALATARTREWCWVLGVSVDVCYGARCGCLFGKAACVPGAVCWAVEQMLCLRRGRALVAPLPLWAAARPGHEQFGPAPPDRRVGGHDRVGGRLRWDYRHIVRPRNEIRFTKFMLANGAGEDAKYERQRAVARITAAQREGTPWKWKGAMKPFDVITEAELNVWHRRYGSQRVILMHAHALKFFMGRTQRGHVPVDRGRRGQIVFGGGAADVRALLAGAVAAGCRGVVVFLLVGGCLWSLLLCGCPHWDGQNQQLIGILIVRSPKMIVGTADRSLYAYGT